MSTFAIATLAGFAAVYSFISEGVYIGITSKKKKIYREVCEELALGINKLYLFQQKALEDVILTDEEIKECIKIVQEINGVINNIKARSDTNNKPHSDPARTEHSSGKSEKYNNVMKKELIKEQKVKNDVIAKTLKLEYKNKILLLRAKV